MNWSVVFHTKIFELPESIIQKICQLLISYSVDSNKLNGFRNVLAFRSTSYHFYHTINNCSLKLTYFISISRISKKHEKITQLLLLKHLSQTTNWKFDQFVIDSQCITKKILSMDDLNAYFAIQRFLICTRFCDLFDKKLKAIVLNLRYSSRSPITQTVQFTNDIFLRMGNQATKIALSVDIFCNRELASIKSGYWHHVKKLTIAQKQLNQIDFIYKIMKMFPNVEKFEMISNYPHLHVFKPNVLKDMPKIDSFKTNILDLTSSNSPILNQIKTLQLEFRDQIATFTKNFPCVEFPNLEILMICITLENETSNETSLFMVLPNLRTLKTNASLLSRICRSNMSKLEELSILYDTRDTAILKNLLSSADFSALRILKIEKKESFMVNYEILWKLAIDILRKRKHLKVLIIRGDDFQSFAPALLEKMEKTLFTVKGFFGQRKPQKFGPDLLYFNFFERILTNQLDRATIRRLDELDSEYKWNLRSSNRAAGGL